MAEQASWTLDELVRRVSAALAVPRTRERPTGGSGSCPIAGLCGGTRRPDSSTGRPCKGAQRLYGTRHLLQIVAVKRRQAQGRSLAEIQAELTGATDETLRRIAAVPDELIAAAPAGPEPPPADAPAAGAASGPLRPLPSNRWLTATAMTLSRSWPR